MFASPKEPENPCQKLSLFLPSLRGGGAERVMVYLANGFARRGFQVDLVLVSAEGQYLYLVNDKVRLVDLKSSRVLSSLPNLIRYLKTEKPNVILSTLDHANLVAILARILAQG